MKIIYLITGLGLGGAEVVVCNLADKMSNLGHKVIITYLTGSIILRPKNINIEIVSLDLDNISQFYQASAKYRKLIRDFQPDVIHAHMVHANIFARVNRIGCSIPKLICTAHSSNEGGKLRMFAYRLTNFLSNFNTNVSQEASNALVAKGAFNKNNLITVYNGIDLNKFKSLSIEKSLDEVMVLSVGRFNEPKDYPNLFKAIKLLNDRTNTKIKFYVAGDGELRLELEQLIDELGISNYITLLGKRSDIPELMNQAHFFVLPSKFEGFGLVVAEAMACGAYVIATNCGGVAEVMGNTGSLVPPENSEALAKAINNAIHASKAEIIENNLKARQRVEELFCLEKSVQIWLSLYERN